MSKKGHGGGSVGHSAPLWFISWADMCTLLLGFFIILYSMSESGSKSPKYEAMVQSVQAAFGIQPGMGMLTQTPTELQALMKMQSRARDSFKAEGEETTEGLEGEDTTIRRIREGLEFCMGSTVAFEEGKAVLLPSGYADLLKVADTIRGYNNKVEIRGHTSKAALPEGSPYRDNLDLSYARARAVRDFMADKGGIRANRIRVAAVGDTEPLIARAYNEAGRKRNSRVEIIVNESMVQEFEGEPTETPQPASPGATEATTQSSETQGVSHGR